MSELALCEMVALPLLGCILGMNSVSHWGIFPLPTVVKQKAYKAAF